MKKIKLSVAAMALLLAVVSCASATQKIISFEPAIGSFERVESIESLGGKVTREFHIINALAAAFPDDVEDADIYLLEGVTNVEEDKYLKWIEEAPAAIPLSSVATALKQVKAGEYEALEALPVPSAPKTTDEEKEIPWGVNRVNAAGAWPVTMGEGVKVAVLDTGIDYDHPDLQANYAGGYTATPSTSPIGPLTKKANRANAGGYTITISSAPPLDDNGHGTHVAGTIAAVRDLKGVVGVAPKAKIYSVKVLDKNGYGRVSWIIAGIEWAADTKTNVINMSLGGPYSVDSFAQAVEAAYKKGVVIVCSAGNTSGSVNYPAKYPESIAVSASDSLDKIALFSSRGPEIDFIAPGVDVYSTYRGSAYATMSGTSMASPHVAGLAALAIALGADTPAKVKEALTKAAVSINLQPDEQGAGLIDAGKLVNNLRP